MTLAMKKLQNVGWLTFVFAIAILLYPLSLNVAAVRSDLERIDRKVMDTKREISFLEAELATRANVAQLDEWNELLYGYQAPTAAQFLDGERALAQIGGVGADATPVLVSVSDADGIGPAGEIGRPGAIASRLDKLVEKQNTAVAYVPENVDASTRSGNAAAVRKTENSLPARQVDNSRAAVRSESAAVNNRTARLARIDEQLLSDTVLKEINMRSKEERKRR
jgi:hypothetical protein